MRYNLVNYGYSGVLSPIISPFMIPLKTSSACKWPVRSLKLKAEGLYRGRGVGGCATSIIIILEGLFHAGRCEETRIEDAQAMQKQLFASLWFEPAAIELATMKEVVSYTQHARENFVSLTCVGRHVFPLKVVI